MFKRGCKARNFEKKKLDAFYNWSWVCSNEGVRSEILRKKSWIIKSFSILLGAIFSYTFFEIDRYGGFSMFFCLCFLDNIFQWQFTIRGPRGRKFEGGLCHGVFEAFFLFATDGILLCQQCSMVLGFNLTLSLAHRNHQCTT